MNHIKFNNKYLLTIVFISALGGFLFGYDWVVIGGAKPFYEVYFDITDLPALQGWGMSSALIGCVFGAMISGLISDRFGRKKPLQIAAVLFVLSALGTGGANSFNVFILYRIIGGVGIGIASTLSPLYIAEVSPAKYRGRFVAINQLTIVIGILAAQIVNWIIAKNEIDGDAMLWNQQTGWRLMFWAELIPAILFFGCLFLVPETPRFLIKSNMTVKALKVLKKIGNESYAFKELALIEGTLQTHQKTKGINKKELKKLYPILIIGVVLSVFQQWCGINIVFNYADEIFTTAGYSVGDMLFNIVITGSINLVFTFVAMGTVDSWGRRKLMLFGALGLAIVYVVLGAAYYFNFQGWPILLLVLMAIAIYAMTLAPVTWVVISEIFPNRIRGVAMSVATLSLWVASFVLTYTFPFLNTFLGAYGTFWCYSVICLLGFVFVYRKLPETKGKTLEEIEEELIKK
ncbi:sugar porter family MFS transporter [Zhouia spongiae]|uniref:Sugar porter family MFS transporter n=1 Tax=Zhouia spongiae TaxID=2202721 RepID=A0ABY3YJW4_9FLAO|nr:sugar porter family MFS transporter [Zhouia spongiae]UNY97873.1 sugar porter family MFS transporter [Zhouia spongiae]